MRAAAALLPALAFAQEPGIQASVDVNSVTLADTITLQISIEAPQGYDRFDPPDLRDFQIADTGQQTQTHILMQGGRLEQRSTETYTYVLRPLRAGDLVIGAARLQAGGRTLESRPITVQVAQGGTGGPPVGQSVPAPQGLPAAQDESLFLQAAADRAEVWVGEQVNVTWSLYTQADVLHYRPTRDPATGSFWAEELYSPRLQLQFDRQIVDGRLYFVAPLRKKALFPLRDGDLAVGSLEAEIVTAASRRFANEPVQRIAPELTIRVRPLPAEGRPDGFAPANVGRYTMEAHVDRTQVQAGEPVSLHVIIRGTGNIRGLKAPTLAEAGFKVYEPRVEDRVEVGTPVTGEKRVDYVLLPSAGGAVTIPALVLQYFDPASGGYAAARTDPIGLSVIGDPSALTSGQAVPAPRDNLIVENIRPIHHRADLRRMEPGEPLVDRVLPIALVVPPLGYFAAVAVGFLRARANRDTPGFRRRRGRLRVQARLRLAKERLRAGDAAGFFAEAARSLAAALDDRLDRRVDGMTRDELSSALSERGGPDLASDVLKELDNCDFARFAPSAAREGEMRACLERLPGLLERIERVP